MRKSPFAASSGLSISWTSPAEAAKGTVMFAANRDETIEAMISEETESPKTSKGFAYTIEVQQ